MRVDFDTIECRSAFDLAGNPSSLVECPVDLLGPGIRVVELGDVLYLPSVLDQGQSICLHQERFVPEESVLDCSSVGFLKERRRKSPTADDKYGREFDAGSFNGTVCVLGNLFSRNFGHWTEELLKVAILERLEVSCHYVVSDLPPFGRAFLAFLGIDEDRIVSPGDATIFTRALFTTAISHDNVSAFPSVLFHFRDLVTARLGAGESRYGDRLWLERAHMVRNGGRTVNKEEVYRLLEKHGFDIVDVGALSVADQLRTVSQATAIAGPHGAQFVHAQFMPLSSNVIECFSPVHVNPSVLDICRTLKHSYHQIVARSHLIAPYEHGRDCLVDCGHLALVLDFIDR